jgi:hypothetical protein
MPQSQGPAAHGTGSRPLPPRAASADQGPAQGIPSGWPAGSCHGCGHRSCGGGAGRCRSWPRALALRRGGGQGAPRAAAVFRAPKQDGGPRRNRRICCPAEATGSGRTGHLLLRLRLVVADPATRRRSRTRSRLRPPSSAPRPDRSFPTRSRHRPPARGRNGRRRWSGHRSAGSGPDGCGCRAASGP